MTSPDKRLSRMTTTMDTKRLHEPVISKIPERGRMMSSHKIGAEMRDGLKGEKRVCAQTFHEGFVGDKRYLVPDSTLEAMADIIHFKVRHVEDPKNMELFDPTDDQAGLRRWQKKHGSIMQKLDDLTADNEDNDAEGDIKGEQENNGREGNEEDSVEEEEEVEEDIADESKSEERYESQEEEDEEAEEEVEEEGDSEEEGGEVEEDEGGAAEDEGKSEEEEGRNGSQEEGEEEEEVEESGNSEKEGSETEEEEGKSEEGQFEVEEDGTGEQEEDDEEKSYVVKKAEEEASEEMETSGAKTILEEGDRKNTIVTLFRGQGVSYEASEVCKDSASGEEEKPVDEKDRKPVDEGGEAEIKEQFSSKAEADYSTSEPVQLVKEECNRNQIEEPNSGFDVTRFLISGHIRSNRKPIYIVQKYHGPSLFRNKEPEFFSRKSEQDMDVLMRGQFFKESILEEDRYMQPVRLKTTPRRVVIDSMSKVFEGKFTHVFVGTEVDIQISGSFVDNSQRALYTPTISIILRKGTDLEAQVPPGDSTSVRPMKPIENKVFERENMGRNEKLKTIDGASFPNRRSASGDTRLSGIAQRRYESLLEPESTTNRWRNVRRSFSREESPSDILEAFVRAEREKRRERRRRERQINTTSVFKPFLFWK